LRALTGFALPAWFGAFLSALEILARILSAEKNEGGPVKVKGGTPVKCDPYGEPTTLELIQAATQHHLAGLQTLTAASLALACEQCAPAV
jgi:hypothetical protein